MRVLRICVILYLDTDSGGWGPWSAWSECSSNCVGGKRNRYRFCDSPPPQYGTKFCEGKALESESCGNETGWNCQLFQWDEYGDSILPAELPEIKEQIGPGCRCGCVVHLGAAKPRRMLATSSHSCPGLKPTMWLIKADNNHIIELNIEHLKLPCSQWLKIRSGDSILSHLVAHLTKSSNVSYPLYSTGPLIFLEFFSDDVPFSALEECNGGFLIHAKQIEIKPKVSMKAAVSSINHVIIQLRRLTTVHLVISIALLSVLICSICLVIQYIIRYHKYNLAQVSDDEDYPYYSPEYIKRPASAATSTSTLLLSEVIPLHKSKESIPTIVKTESEVECGHEEKYKKNGKKCVIYADDFEKSAKHLDEPSSEDTNLPTICEDSNYENITASTSSILSDSTLAGSITSPAVSLNDMNEKERKEFLNRKRLLNNIGSDLSLTGQDTDLEMDYYDYNVHNASAVPGSYIGMDPAFCVWIPPFAPKLWDSENIIQDTDLTEYKCKTFSMNDSGNVTPVNDDASDVNTNRLSMISNDTVMTICDKPNEENIIKGPLLPDSPVKIQKAVIKKENISLELMSDIKFMDEDEKDYGNSPF